MSLRQPQHNSCSYSPTEGRRPRHTSRYCASLVKKIVKQKEEGLKENLESQTFLWRTLSEPRKANQKTRVKISGCIRSSSLGSQRQSKARLDTSAELSQQNQNHITFLRRPWRGLRILSLVSIDLFSVCLRLIGKLVLLQQLRTADLGKGED